MEEKLDKIYKLAIAIVIIVSINLLFTLGGLMKTKTDTTNNTTTDTEETTANYDVSTFNTLDLDGVLKLFDNNKTYVVYIGRSTCSACVSFLPTLKEMQSKYGYVTQYLDITTVDVNTDSFTKFEEKLSKKVSAKINGETKNESFSSYYGYTPMTFIIKDGKFADGIIGAASQEKFETFLNDNGIKK